MSNEQLVFELKEGDEKAFRKLISVYSPKVFNLCYRFLLNIHDAEDVAQEVFLEIHKSISTFKGESKLSTWIYRIATTKCLDELKKRNRKKRITSLGKTIGLEKIAGFIAGGNRPDYSAEENESVQFIMSALDSLPENQRIALTLSKLQDYGNNEIAELMNLSLTAVDSLIYRGKQNLKAALEKQKHQNLF